METWKLSLRARKLLHYLYNRTTYTTSGKLANYLHVSSRTIRNDINDINKTLNDFEIKIMSKASEGYLLVCNNKEYQEKLKQASNIILTREDSIRYITFKLCLADEHEPVDLYDLEEEMGLSMNTLKEHIKAINRCYPLFRNNISFNKETIFIKIDERSKRAILNQLFAETWNYDGEGNAYYQYEYLNEKTVNVIMYEVNYQLMRHCILIEDVNMVVLKLMIAIMFYRVSNNHELKEESSFVCQDKMVINAVDAIIDNLSEKLSCKITAIERNEIYIQVSCSRLLECQWSNCIPDKSLSPFTPWGNDAFIDNSKIPAIETVVDSKIINAVNSYIRSIRDTFALDIQKNKDFYAKLLAFLRYLSLPLHFIPPPALS